MFLLVELTFLGEQNFNLGLYSINFWSQRSNSIIKRWFFEFLYGNKSPNKVKIDIFKLSSMRSFVWCINFDVLKRKIIFYIFTYGLWPISKNRSRNDFWLRGPRGPGGKDFLRNFNLFYLSHALTTIFIIKVCFPANTDNSGYGNDINFRFV
jgi:hypothetical protein